MKKYLYVFLVLIVVVQKAYSCSSFVLKNEKKVLLGKNFDWTLDKGSVIKNPRNTTKVAYFTHNGTPISWVSKYGSITFNQNGKEMPYGGMNEKGLVVEMLWLEETRFNLVEDKTYLNELEWIQYQLDNYQSVDEVIANVENLKIYPIKGKIHYIMADIYGKSVIIEYLEGKPKIYEKQANICQAITNNSVVFSEKYIDDLQGTPQKNTSEIYRYHQLEKHIRKLQKSNEFSEETAFEMLKNVSIPKGNFKTVWSIVYNVKNKTVSFFSHKHKKIKQINLKNIDFEQGLSFYDINQNSEIILDNKLKPFSEDTNFKMVASSLTHLGFDTVLGKEISEHQMNQKPLSKSYFSENYFHFDISIPIPDAGKNLIFVVMDSQENFDKKVAVTGGYAFGKTSIGTFNSHIYGLKNGKYSMIALLDENKNSELDFDAEKKPVEKYAIFGRFIPKSMAEITFKNTSADFNNNNSKMLIEWR